MTEFPIKLNSFRFKTSFLV